MCFTFIYFCILYYFICVCLYLVIPLIQHLAIINVFTLCCCGQRGVLTAGRWPARAKWGNSRRHQVPTLRLLCRRGWLAAVPVSQPPASHRAWWPLITMTVWQARIDHLCGVQQPLLCTTRHSLRFQYDGVASGHTGIACRPVARACFDFQC